MSLPYEMQGCIPMFHGQSAAVASSIHQSASSQASSSSAKGRKSDGSTRKSIKHTPTADEAREKRKDMTIKLRQETRENEFAKRRRSAGVGTGDAQPLTAEQVTSLVAELPRLCQMVLQASDPGSSLYAVNQLRRALEQTDQMAMRAVFEVNGLLQRFVDILGTPNLPFELYDEIGDVMQLLTVCASTDQTLLMIKMGFITLLLPLLRSGGSASGLDSACCFYGNVLSENSATRKAVLDEGVLQLLLNLLNTNQVPRQAMDNAIWFFVMLTYSKPAIEWTHMEALLPILGTIIQTYVVQKASVSSPSAAAASSSSSSVSSEPMLTFSDGTVDHAVMALHYILSYSKLKRFLKAKVDVVERVQALNVTPCLVQLLSSRMKNTVRHSVACLEFMSGGTLPQITRLLDADFLRSETVCKLLVHGSKDVKNSLAMILNRITKDPDETIPRFIQSGLVPVVINLLDDPTESPRDMLEQLAGVLRNLLALGHDHATVTTVDYGALQTLMRVIDALDVDTQYDVLTSVKRVLQYGDVLMEQAQKDTNRFAEIMRECEGDRVLEQLGLYTEERADYLSESHEELSKLVHEILLEWFDEGDMANQDLADAVAGSSATTAPTQAASSASSFFMETTQPAAASSSSASTFSFATAPMFSFAQHNSSLQQQPNQQQHHHYQHSNAPASAFVRDRSTAGFHV
jgi:hypothetical protein